MAEEMERRGSGGGDTPRPSGRREVRLYLARLRGLAERLDHQAALIRNGGFNTRAEAEAGRLADEAFAIRWALRQIAPEIEAVRQVLGAQHRLR
jgi:hypothetical protein